MKEWLRTALVGIAMGAAEVVPGVSGGTIAFISGIYVRLLRGISHFTPALLLSLRRDGLKVTWVRTDSTFLLMLVVAMGGSVLTFASGVTWLLVNRPVWLWAFFFGLVIASAIVVGRSVEVRNLAAGVFAGLGIGVGLLVTTLTPINLEPTGLNLFLAGSVAICAWILPGVSGSFILLILGLYAFVIDAVRALDILTLAVFGCGCLLGIISFARVLTSLFERHRDVTLALLTGFMLGSLVKLWPWKHTLSYQLKSDGSRIPLVQEPVLPGDYVAVTGMEPELLAAVICAVVGFGLVFLVDWLARRHVEGDAACEPLAGEPRDDHPV